MNERTLLMGRKGAQDDGLVSGNGQSEIGKVGESALVPAPHHDERECQGG